MINNIISLLFGILLKIVDDHYDMNLYDKRLIYWVKFILTFITLYWINIDFDYCTAIDRKSTRLNSSHSQQSRMPSSA